MRLFLLFAAFASFCPLLFAQDDSAGDAIHASTVYHEDGTRTQTVTDPGKHTSEATTYDAHEKVMQKIVYTLDENDQAETGIIYNGNGAPLYKSSYKHDSMNRISEEDDYSMDDTLIRRFVYHFDTNGKVSGITAYDGQGNEIPSSPARKDRHQSAPRVH